MQGIRVQIVSSYLSTSVEASTQRMNISCPTSGSWADWGHDDTSRVRSSKVDRLALLGGLFRANGNKWDRNACNLPPWSPELARYHEGLGQFTHLQAIHGDSSSCLDFHHLWAIFWLIWLSSMLPRRSSNILTLSLAYLWLWNSQPWILLFYECYSPSQA